MELAIDSSTEIASLALSARGEVIAELTWHSGRSHTVELVPNLVHLLRQARAGLDGIAGIAVAKGPGSFSGLRVGMSTAKGLAFALGVPLVGISTLEVAAFPYAGFARPVCSLLHAGRGEIATALFQTKRGEWRQLRQEHITTIDSLCAELPARTVLCGQITPEVAARLREQLGQRAIILGGEVLWHRAGHLAELGWRRLERGDIDDPATLQPLYLRLPSVTIKGSGSISGERSFLMSS